jgi:hypothetical protein
VRVAFLSGGKAQHPMPLRIAMASANATAAEIAAAFAVMASQSYAALCRACSWA